ncbi:MAG: DUF4365 domain-containing protein [Nonlabens sp.]|uniref:DUF4365 domain-containing protein n=1 Tax=Nonlabens sp. TaxID=1888209 RepID=UPI003EF84EEE
MRYNKIERIGVNAAESIFINDFDWIFRVQDAVDVGIDAFVEQSVNGDPKGKFIALQIKSGKGNFHVSKNSLTYYISNIHYNYWLNFDIPVIIIAHLPENKKTYWQEISKVKIEKIKKSWKLVIPYENLLNYKSKSVLTKLLSNKRKEYQSIKIFQGKQIDERSLYHLSEKTKCIADANESTSRMVNMIEEMGEKTRDCGEKVKHFNKSGQSIKSPEAEAVIWRFAKDIMILSKRMDNENQIFTESFTEGLFAYEQILKIHKNMNGNDNEVYFSKELLNSIPSSINQAISGVNYLKQSTEKLPDDFEPLKQAKYIMIEVLDNYISDYEDAKKMVIELSNSI